jgi:hypothetical protein
MVPSFRVDKDSILVVISAGVSQDVEVSGRAAAPR